MWISWNFKQRWVSREILSAIFVLFVILKYSSGGQSKTFLRNNFSKDQETNKNYYPSDYKRFRRGYGLQEESEINNQFNAFGGGSSSDSFGTFRKTNLGNLGTSRKGAQRSFSGRGFPGYGGPDAFLSPSGTTEDENEEEAEAVGFGSNTGNFPGFGSSSSSWGKQVTNSKGRSKGGIKTAAAAMSAKPASINFGSETSRFGGSGGSQFSFGNSGSSFGASSSGGNSFPSPGGNSFGSSVSSGSGGPSFGSPISSGSSGSSSFGSPVSGGSSGVAFGSSAGNAGNSFIPPGSSNFGSSGNNPFGGSPAFGNQNSFFGSFGNSKGRTFSSSKSSKSSFSSGGENFPNPFVNPAGGSFGQETGGFGGSSHQVGGSAGNPFGNIGNLVPYSGNIEDISGGKMVGPFKSFPDISNLDLNSFLEQLEPTTTTKKPLRVISEEDKNKIFSGDFEDLDDDKEGESLLPLTAESEETDLGYPNPFQNAAKGKTKKTKASLKKDTSGCKDPPETPVNANLGCTPTSGCRLDCLPGYQTPDGEVRLYIVCENRKWVVKGQEYTEIPNCQPICDPPCQNEGICLAPNLCNCPDGWEGPHCEKSKKDKQCSNKPPTPQNTRIFCGKEECVARCIEGYQYEQGITKLSFVCINGKWNIKNPDIERTPNCKPICDPECTNGGICLAPNLCECSSDFRGPICQYPISNCDPKKLNFNGGYNCSGENMNFGCKLWCPEGINFKFPEAELYKCDYATGKWSPFPIPECDYQFLLATEKPFEEMKIIKYEEPIKPKSGICFTWSGSHYKSFDGKVYSFESGCPYTLLQDSSLGTFSINLMTEEGCRGPKCKRSLNIFTEDDQYILGNLGSHPVITYRDTSLAIPGQMNGLVSERVAHFVVLKLTGIGLTLKWDLQNLFIAEVSELLWNRTSGLCGRLDGSKGNDWAYSDGTVEANQNAFLKAWQATTVGAPCLESPITKSSCSPIENFRADAFCSQLSQDPRFDACREVVDVEPFQVACQWDYCACENKQNPSSCACNSLAAYFTECTNSGGAVQGGWRTPELCPMTCDEGLEYKSCMPAIQPRCGQAADTAKPEFCVEGCDCPDGLVLNLEGFCILPEECPCTYHNKTYFPGDTIPNDCNSCTCLSGEWVCTEVKCGSRCSSIGDPHYTTFDGKKYDFMGKCSYYLARGEGFSIEAENVPCAGAISKKMNFPTTIESQFPSCTKSLTIKVAGTKVHLKQGRDVTINGEEVKDFPVWVNSVFVKEASSLFVLVHLDNGIEVWWDGQTRAYVDAPPQMRGQVSGLCGTFNDNQKDDFLTPEGDNEQNPIAFANKWKTSRKCSDVSLSEEAHPCDRHVQNKGVAEKYCAKIKSKLFSACHFEVDPESFYRDCLYDLCSCEAELKECLCPILAAYGKECARKGILLDWRSQTRECGVHCTGGQKYQICGDSCTRKCYDLATQPDCKRRCVEGCNCPEGFALNVNSVCVPVSQCPCIYEGKEFKPNYEMFQKVEDGTLEICKCEKAQWKCRQPTDVEKDAPEFFTEPQVNCLKEKHEVYTDCLPEEEPSCSTMHLILQEQPDMCRPGCKCEEGYVLNDETNECISFHKCPCHHGGRTYKEEATIVEECNTCVCEDGLWSCSQDPCPATCTAWGDSHYKTFDGRIYDFHGTCDYMLAKGKLSRNDVFEVSMQNVPCGTNGVTCAKSLTLRVGVGESQEVIHFSRNKPTPLKNMTRTIIREAGVFIFAEVADMGLELQWDKGTRTYITLGPDWKGKHVQGLCGNYNGDENDDFQTPSGGSGEVSAKIFGDSWRLQNYCPESILIEDTCSIHPHRKVWASEKCSILKSSTFSPCHSEVPVESYLERCQFDACGCDTGGDCHCLCTAVAAYAQECNINGVYIKWRTPDFCPMQCDESCERYEPCIPACPQETCDSYKEPQSTLCRRDACVEGCAKDVCPPGTVHKSITDKECVPKIECDKKCMEIDDHVYMEGDMVSSDECHTCYCTKGKKTCKGTPCETTTPFLPESPRYSTRVSTPSVTTLDEEEGCKSGWSVWLNQDHPIVYKKNSDIESVPDRIIQTLSSRGFCGRDMYDDIRCRSVGDHQPPLAGVVCNLEEGLRCEMPKGASKGGRKCFDYEISILCDCSKEISITQPTTTPETPVTAPPIIIPSVPPTEDSIPESCEERGWTRWFNVHFPTKFGEFETLDSIRDVYQICPDHYVESVECRLANGDPLDPHTTCDIKGAMCRNNGGYEYCQDSEVRVFCECKCQDGLGMEDGSITDDKISVSSSISGSLGRFNSDDEWIPDVTSGSLSDQWLQIDLGGVKEVTGVITQGHSEIDAFVSSFAVQVSESGAKWEEIRDEETDFAKRFTGNTNSKEVVTNLFPKPVFVKFVRIIPLSFNLLPALRVELKGCDEDDSVQSLFTPKPNTTVVPFPKTPFPEECQDGWTQWMNSHTPSPSNWDDIENYKKLRMIHTFCEEESIQRVECRVSTIHTSYKESGQIEISCNRNIGLQCVDELQKEHCFDYEIRFFCDCSLTTIHTYLPTIDYYTSTTSRGEELQSACDLNVPSTPHETDCQKFYECQPLAQGYTLVEKECGPGTLYNPNTFICDWSYVVQRLRPECLEEDKISETTPSPSCEEDYWTDWFNISHPEDGDGDFELIDDIIGAGLSICERDYIIDIQCQFENIKSTKTQSKGGGKGSKFAKGRPKPDRYTSQFSDVTSTTDEGVTCRKEEGLRCLNGLQKRRMCQDYSIRVLCSCDKRPVKIKQTTEPTTSTDYSFFTTTLPDINYTDVRTLYPTTSPRMYNDYWCPPGKYFEEYAIKCINVCVYYRQFLMQQGRCLDDDETAPACVDQVTGTACPPGYFLRDNRTCVAMSDCNCMLPNGLSAPPERTFLVSDCEICKCSNNELLCDNERCFDKLGEFDCDEWSPWMSVSAPSGQGDMETLEVLKRYHPQICDVPEKIECREKGSEKFHYQTGQKVTCNNKIGLQCLNKNNPGGCKDYEVRIFCACKLTSPSLSLLTTPPDKKYFTTTPLPPLEGCVEPYWSEWFNVTHPRVKGGDYELIDVVIKNGLDICPKSYISKIECAFYKEVQTPTSAASKKKSTKGKPAKYRTSYELADYTESDDMYVTCSKLSGLTCVNALQAKSKKCQDYAIRVFCNCESDEIFEPKEKFTPAGTTSTTPYPGWPVVGPDCEEEKTRVECAIECHRTCLFYRHYLNLRGDCHYDDDCAPACMEPSSKEACPEGLYMSDNSTCVAVEDCTCRLPNGQPLPGGVRMQVSKCEWCSCEGNSLLCETTSGCVEPPSEPEIQMSSVPSVQETKQTTASTITPLYTTQPPLSLIKIRCNEWTPWMNMKRTSEGDSQKISDLRAQYGELCEKPLNISCRDAIAKLPAEQLGQTITCSTTEGLICRNDENREDCYDYEVSLFCECEGDVTPAPEQTTKMSRVTTELAPCDSYSPWINEHKPWLEDGDTEFKTLEQLHEKYSFCMEGYISEIECLEATSGMDISVNKGVRCDKSFGLRCKNQDQENGVCYDFKIRYFCTCGTTIATRPTLLVRTTPTPPSVCSPDKYIKLLEFVDDSDFSSTSSINSAFGPASARLNTLHQHGGAWIPREMNTDQYLQINLGEIRTLYGFYIAGSALSNERVTSLSVSISDDEIVWSPVHPLIFRGPRVSTVEELNLFTDPVEAQYIRFSPNTWSGAIAMRVEVVGCSIPTPTPVPTSPKPPICDEEMGFENGALSEDQISVSSVLNDMEFFYGKGNVRLNTKAIPGLSGGAWVAYPSLNEYIRFDFLQPSKISGIVTQGRDQTQEFVESYIVRYSPDGKIWSTITDPKTGKDKIFSGNYDSSTPNQNTFDRVIETRYLEIKPLTWNENIAMRIEVKGCFHPYPEVTKSPTPTSTRPPPPYCNACPNLPSEYYNRCYPCQINEKFDGEFCVPEILCPCYYDGVKYILGSYFETKDCEKCSCEGNGKTNCEPIQCEKCIEEGERPVQTPSCKCVCKPCSEETRLCKTNDFCLENEKWCDGIEHCPDDENDCPTLAPPECPVPPCPEEWELVLEMEGDEVNCPQYTCKPPIMTTPMSCPSPLCPFGYNIILVPKKSYEACPKYECEAPLTTLEPYTCPPPVCPDGYDTEITPPAYDQYSQSFGNYEQESYDENEGCPQYKCVTNAPPTAPCPPPNCPQGYDVNYPNMKDLLSLCPTYECVPIVTTTPCPPVQCPKGLQTLFVQTDGELCPQYTCIKITTPSVLTTPMITDMPCTEVALPVCEPGEEIYQANPQDPCPIFKCKKIGVPISTTGAPKISKPTCERKNNEFKTFDGTDYRMEICHHVMARDKIANEWEISIHQNCTNEPCERYLRIKEDESTLVLNPDLTMLWDGHTYSVSQAQKIGQTRQTFSISKVGDSLVYKSQTRNYSVVWNTDSNVKIEISDNAIYQVDGLCGFYSGSPVDDRTKPDGSLASSTMEFGDAWSMPEGDCKKVPKKCSPEDSKKAFILCNALDSKPFTECHDVLPVESYLKGCVDRLCVCLKENKTEEECKCGVLASYITACLEKKPDAKVADWRIVTKCYKECPAGEIYNDCYKDSCEKSCENLNDPDACSDTDGPCLSGCFCEPGLVRKGKSCVVPESCRDCICEGYGDPHYKTFDRKNFTFNGECPYVAARDVDPTGKHQFQIITHNKRCQRDPVTMCTDSVEVLFKKHNIKIQLLPTNSLATTINGEIVKEFPIRKEWVAMESPDTDRVILVIPEIELEVSYSKDNYGFNIRVPSHLFKNKLEGLCGNCNFDPTDDFKTKEGAIVDSVKDFGLSWVADAGRTCQVFEKETMPCMPPSPERDPCLKLMDKEKFGECHPLEDPVAYISSCQLDLCLSLDPQKSACQSLEAYARRCAQMGACLDWRSDYLCPKTCPKNLEYVACGPGCVKTCDNYEELNKNPKSCSISSSDGCYCPNNMILDNGTCVNESACATCDAEGHRVGEVWNTDKCTVCECSNGAAICRTTSCPLDPVCNDGYIIEEVPGTYDECCGHQKTCKVKPLTDCLEPIKPKQDCGYGKRLKLIEAPGVCPEYACVCVDANDCPEIQNPNDDDLKTGEEWIMETEGCCPHYVTSCTGECPTLECQEFYTPDVKPLEQGQCCPKQECLPPDHACIYVPQYVVVDGYERPLRDDEVPSKELHEVGEKWLEGLCIECECNLDTNNKPATKCIRKTCAKIEEHPDRKDYFLEEISEPNTCCRKIIRAACVEDGEEFKINETKFDLDNACRKLECKLNKKESLEKVEQLLSCDENCPLGWTYKPSLLTSVVCCGQCEQVACEFNGALKAVGETWLSEDLCTVYECIRDETDKIQTRGKEIQCMTPTEDEKTLYLFNERKGRNTCCSTHTREACLVDGIQIKAGEEVSDPNDKCLRIVCENSSDGNVTRREKEQTCNLNCPLGHVYMAPSSDSQECCGSCFQTQCVDNEKIHPIGETWENPKDICYQYTCDMRDDVLTVVAIKRDCPYFDPECPPSEILEDPTGCCKICNITRETKRECEPEEIDPKDTIDMFVLEARTVGKCTNPNPVYGFKRCNGQCDSKTIFRAQGIEARHISDCTCCRPSRMSQIEVVLKCNRGYSFQRVYDNIEECECQPCESAQRDDQYVNDQDLPLGDLTQFIPLNDEGSLNT